MNRNLRKVAALIFALCLLAFAVLVFNWKTGHTRNSHPQIGALRVAAPVVAGSDDLFEDVTVKAGIGFVHQFCDSRIANILESNGAGGCWIDYNGDGLMDLF